MHSQSYRNIINKMTCIIIHNHYTQNTQDAELTKTQPAPDNKLRFDTKRTHHRNFCNYLNHLAVIIVQNIIQSNYNLGFK